MGAVGEYSATEMLEMYRRMRVIRRFEQRTAELYRATEVPGFVHTSIGQEATAVGACWHLETTDVITSNHRGHGHCLAKGMQPGPMFAELMGKDSGTCHGRGGSMHIADPDIGVFGANGIVGAGIPIAVGAATSMRLRNNGRVALSFFGDGAVAQGAFHEGVNLAAVWNLPIVFVCENNHYAEFSSTASQHRVSLAERARGYGVEFIAVDGNDVRAVSEATGRAIESVRSGGAPVIVEALTYRWHGHYEGDPEKYRDPEELSAWKERDPLLVCKDALTSLGVDSALVDGIDAEVENEIDSAIEQARQAPPPPVSSLMDFVVDTSGDGDGDGDGGVEPEPFEPNGTFKMMHAVREAIESQMRVDPEVFMAGIDIGLGGSVFGLFRGMHEEFPDRVRDTPISETAIVGTAVGAAMAGMKPIVEVMYLDFIGVCLDQIMNQAAKLRYMTGGRAQMSLVIRTQMGAGRSSGSQHSQSLEAMLAHIPGLRVVMPSNPADAYGLLRSAILDPNPVVFIENRLLYGMTGDRPPADYLVPIGKAAIVRPGTDVTVVSWSRMLQAALEAAENLAGEGIDAEVIDLRTIAPLDRAAVLASLERTHRLVIVHEAVRDFGVGAELAALAAGEGFDSLRAPVVRVAPPFTPAPYAPALEAEWLPNSSSIADAIRSLVRRNS